MRFRTAACALLLLSESLAAQVHSGPPGYKLITPAAAAESLKVLDKLTKFVTDHPENADAWYHRGMLAWALAARDNVPPPIRGLDWTMLGHMADTSLRKAAQIAPNKIGYKLAAGRYLSSSFGVFNRSASAVLTNAAVNRVRTIADPQLHADAALQAGHLYFRFYDSKEANSFAADLNPVINEGLNPGANGVTPPTAAEVAALLNNPLRSNEFSGEYYYLRAEALFNEAAHELPASGPVFRAKAMLLSARQRWTELIALGRIRLRDAAWDPWGWMALALGTYKTGDPRTGAAAFDSAMVHFDTASMNRIDRIERILRPADSARLARQTPQERAATSRLYWLSADPLWSVWGNEPRLEFLARVAYAEFRWSSDDMGLLGADTDRGRIYTRYGPALTTMSQSMPPSGVLLMTWVYASVGNIQFTGYDQLEFRSPADIAALRNQSPVQWTNINPVRVDSMPALAARFRATSDSMDVVIAQNAPVAALRKESEVTTPPRAFLWILRGGTVAVSADSTDIGDSGVTSFTHRIAKGDYVYRAEASAIGAKSAGRSTGIVTAEPDSTRSFALAGFGMSDVLMGSHIEPNGTSPRRWNDFRVTATAGVVRDSAELALLWENYDFGSENGMAHYDVAISIDRERSPAGKITAGVIRGIAGAVGINQLSDRTEITFERTVAHAPTIVDNLSLSLGETPAGRYKLTVKVTDRTTSRSTSWSGTLVIER